MMWGKPTVAYGANAIETLTGYLFPVQKIRGSLLPVRQELAKDQWVVAALHPSFMLRGGKLNNPGEQDGKSQTHLCPTLAIDARRALESRTPRIPSCKYLESPRGLSVQVPEGCVVSVDIEGANGSPNIVGVSWDEGEAFVFPWSEDLRAWLTTIFERHLCTFHNAAYDIPELELAGVPPPKIWIDTIVLAGLYDASQPMNLQWQVLTHVLGSIAWKGLINHERGPDFEDKTVKQYRSLWTDVLSRLGRPVPATGQQWYQFYNNLDTAWGLALANNLKSKLIAQGRWGYYVEVLQPLQASLLRMGQEGMPLDMAALAKHQVGIQRSRRHALVTIAKVGRKVLEGKAASLQTAVETHEIARAGLRLQGTRKYPQANELTKLRNKLKASTKFNPNSTQQLATILYDHYGLPVIKTEKGGRSVKEEAIEDLTSRVQRGTAKVRGDKDECLQILQSITDYNHWTHWLDTFVNAPIVYHDRQPVLSTTYSLHRTISGRLASGLDDSDVDKKLEKKVNLQNWPKELRDVVRAPEGYVFIGADYAGIEWAIAMWMASKVYKDGYHLDMLDRFFLGTFDPHTFLAGIAGCSRDVAKIFTHGRTFRGSERALARNAGLADRVGLVVCAAHEEAFHLQRWQDEVIKSATKGHKIQTPLGWRAYSWAWKPKPQEVIAWLVSGTAADLCKWVMRRIFEGLEGTRCSLVTSTHDSFLLQVPIEDTAHWAHWLKDQMQQPVPWLDGRQWRADVKVGKTWKDVS